MELELSNIVNISVSQTPAGIGSLNTSNLALFTLAQPINPFADGYKIYLSPSEVATDFGSGSTVYGQAVKVFSQQPNILANNGYLVIIPMIISPSTETLEDAINRTKDLVQYFGIIASYIVQGSELTAAAGLVQTLNKILFICDKDSASLDANGKFDLIRQAGLSQTRCLFYGSVTDTSAIYMMSAYAGRALSTNFSGSNTTQTMQLKDLIGILPDSSMTQTLYEKAQDCGADVYASIQGVAKVMTSGANQFFDQVYNLQWFILSLQVAGFNFLAQSSTKVPQTENGISALKSAYRAVCEQAVTNQYCAPGAWNSPTTFGNQSDFLANISQRGYYIYSIPVAQQSAVDRADRKAPLIQLALKEAGAVHSSNVIVNVNA